MLEKKDIADSDLGTDFIKALKPKKFKFKDGTRQHYGLIAQDVEKLLSDSSIDTKDFAGFIKTPTYKPKTIDVLDREDKKIGEYEEIPITRRIVAGPRERCKIKGGTIIE